MGEGGKREKEKKNEKKKKHIGMLEYLRNSRTIGTRSSKTVRNPDPPFTLLCFSLKETLLVNKALFRM